MSCGCNLNQVGRSKALSSVLVLGIAAVLFVGGCLYMRSRGDCDDCSRAAASSNRTQAELASWNRLSATDLDGSRFAMTDLAGKPTVLYFWATWCPQCRLQRDVLNKLAGEWGGRLRTAALSVDDDAQTVRRYLESHTPLSHELRASPELLELFQVESLPTLAVIDATGRVKTVSAGPMDAAELRGVVAPLLQ